MCVYSRNEAEILQLQFIWMYPYFLKKPNCSIISYLNCRLLCYGVVLFPWKHNKSICTYRSCLSPIRYFNMKDSRRLNKNPFQSFWPTSFPHSRGGHLPKHIWVMILINMGTLMFLSIIGVLSFTFLPAKTGNSIIYRKRHSRTLHRPTESWRRLLGNTLWLYVKSEWKFLDFSVHLYWHAFAISSTNNKLSLLSLCKLELKCLN